VVEDTDALGASAVRTLADGYTVAEARHGQEALKMIETAQDLSTSEDLVREVAAVMRARA
jgi:CheY-like chemotaxis protein